MNARAEPQPGPDVISIDRASPVPLYFQLAQHFENAIRSGALRAGARLDNEVELAERLGLSRPTVRAAFGYLANKGMVTRKRGAGTLVAKERIDRDVELTSLYDDLAAAGRAPTTQVIRNEVGHASENVARALKLPDRALVMCLERIRLADGEPIALMHNFLPAAPCICAARCWPSTGCTSCCAPLASGSARRRSGCRPRTPRRPRPGCSTSPAARPC